MISDFPRIRLYLLQLEDSSVAIDSILSKQLMTIVSRHPPILIMSQAGNTHTTGLRLLSKHLILPEKQAIMKGFPTSHHLVVTMSNGVYTWTYQGVKEIFCSQSRGIIAAEKLSDSSNMLAIADSHGVILHDSSKGMQESFRLKEVEVGTPAW